MTPEETAWSAGLFEGEGTFVYNQARHYTVAQLTMTDLDVVEKFFKTVGKGSLTGPYSPKGPVKDKVYKKAYRWNCFRQAEVCELFELWRPWFGTRRQEQFATCVAKREAAIAGGLVLNKARQRKNHV